MGEARRRKALGVYPKITPKQKKPLKKKISDVEMSAEMITAMVLLSQYRNLLKGGERK